MSKMLVATDFSEVATHAIRYACELAAVYNFSIHLVHAQMVPVTFGDAPVPILPMGEMQQAADAQMQELVAGLRRNFPGLDISGECYLGEVIDVLTDCCTEMLPLLAVLGNSGSADEGAWLGSAVLNGVRRLPCPVLAVPENYAFRQIQTICLACDKEDLAGGLQIGSLLALQRKLNASLQLVTVREPGSEAINIEESELKRTLGSQLFSLQELEAADVSEAVHAAAREMNADWLAVVPHRYGFFTSLFHKSQTKAILHQSLLPVLALHAVEN